MKGEQLQRERSDTNTTKATVETTRESRSGELGFDQLFGILKNKRRRHALQYLREHEGTVSLRDLSEQIAAWENDKEVRRITSTERKRVYVALYQCHLPKMDDMGVVEFEKARGTIAPGEHLELCSSYLDAQSRDDVWPRHYATLAAATAVLVLAGGVLQAALSVPALGAGAGLAVLSFATTSVWQCVSDLADRE